jgi:hypothetical protein
MRQRIVGTALRAELDADHRALLDTGLEFAHPGSSLPQAWP